MWLHWQILPNTQRIIITNSTPSSRKLKEKEYVPTHSTRAALPNTKTTKGISREVQTDIPHEYRCTNSNQIYQKDKQPDSIRLILGVTGVTSENQSMQFIVFTNKKRKPYDDLNSYRENPTFISDKCYQQTRTMKGTASAWQRIFKFTANIVLQSGILNIIPLKSGKRQECLVSLL